MERNDRYSTSIGVSAQSLKEHMFGWVISLLLLSLRIWQLLALMLCCDPCSPDTPYPGTCSYPEPSLSHVLRRRLAEAFSEFYQIGIALPLRLSGRICIFWAVRVDLG